MQISKWGNSLSVRLPKEVVEALGLKEGDDVKIVESGERSLALSHSQSKEEALKILRRLHKYRGLMPDGFKFNRDDANER